ncbi:hypothetical protein FQR65_LT03846 [Abscondita terminalis]|nr:hypothetical protein FQR65_LT03846 [Abscondita terminalis]
MKKIQWLLLLLVSNTFAFNDFNQIRICVRKVMSQIFEKSSTVVNSFIDKNMITNINDVSHIVVNISNDIKGAYDKYATNYIVQAKTINMIQFSLYNLLNGHLSNWHRSKWGKFIIITEEKNISAVFECVWNLLVTDLVVMFHDDVNANVIIYTSNQFTRENRCGSNANKIEAQKCSSDTNIIFPEIIKNYNNCSYIYGTYNGVKNINNITPLMYSTKLTLAEIENMLNISLYVKQLAPNQHDTIKGQYRRYFASFLIDHSLDGMTDIFFYDDILWFGTNAEKRLNTFFIPFSIKTWILILVVFVLILLIWRQGLMLQKLNNDKLQRLFESFSQTSSLLFGVGLPVIPKSICIKLIILPYLFYIIHIQTAYTSDLINNLVIPQYEGVINNAEDLAKSDIPILIFTTERKAYFIEDVENFDIKVMSQIFEKSSTVINSFIDKNMITNINEVSHIVVNISNEIKGNYDKYATNYIVQAKTINMIEFSLNNVLSGRLSNWHRSKWGKFIVITGEKNISAIFEYTWNFFITDLVVLYYDDNNENLIIYTSNQFSNENMCGLKANKIEAQKCSSDANIIFPEVIKNYNNCSYIYGMYNNVKNINNITPLMYSMKLTLKAIQNMLNITINLKQLAPNAHNFVKNRYRRYFTSGLIDFTSDGMTDIFFYDDLSWFGTKAEKLLNTFFIPFTIDTWILILVVFVLIVLIWRQGLVFQKLNANKLQPLFESFSQTSSLLFGVGLPVIPKSICIKFIILPYLFYIIHIQTAYTSDLINNLVVPQYEDVINNVEDLAKSDIPIFILPAEPAILATHTFVNRQKLRELLLLFENKMFLPDEKRGSKDKESKMLKEWNSVNRTQCILYVCSAGCSLIGQVVYTLSTRVLNDDYHKWKLGFAEGAITINITYSPNFEINGNESHYLRRYLQDAIIYHINITDLADKVMDMFSDSIFITFVFSLGLVCISAYRASLHPVFELHVAIGIIEALCGNFPSALICFYGENMRKDSEDVALAAYEIDFVGTDLDIQKSIVLLIRRSQTATKVRAGKFVEASLATLVSIMRASFSTYMMLRTVNAKLI